MTRYTSYVTRLLTTKKIFSILIYMDIHWSEYSFLQGFSTTKDICRYEGDNVFVLADIEAFWGLSELYTHSKSGIWGNTIMTEAKEPLIFIPTNKKEMMVLSEIVSILRSGEDIERDRVFSHFEKLPPVLYSPLIPKEVYDLLKERAAEIFPLEKCGAKIINAVTKRDIMAASLLKKIPPKYKDMDDTKIKEFLSCVKRSIDLNERRIPAFCGDDNALLRQKCLKSLHNISRAGKGHKYMERFKYEYSVITDKQLAGYFLIVSDMVNWARSRGIYVGPARGSAAGALVSFLLGITDIDPIRFSLTFERFLNPSREELPDIDLDFSHTRRKEVFRYMEERYGKEKTGHLSTIVRFGWRGALRHLQREMNWEMKRVKMLTAHMPTYFKGNMAGLCSTHPLVADMISRDSVAKKYVQTAELLVGRPHTFSVHPSGYFVLNSPVSELSPLHPGDNGEKISHITKDTELKILKIDCLGLRYLNVVCETAADAGHDPMNFINTVNRSNKHAYALLKEANTQGIFQLESAGVRSYLKKLAPVNIEDMIAIVSLYRPGPLSAGVIGHYIKRRKGEEAADPVHPALTDILAITYGIIVFQEQVMKIGVKLAGFNWSEANVLRRAMAARDRKKMARMKERFIKGMAENNTGNSREAAEIWTFLEKFASYGFNRSHAAGYGLLAYCCAYLKANEPLFYFKNLLNNFIDMPGVIQNYIFDAARNKIEVVPPDINRSQAFFSISEGRIISGYLSIKGISIKWAKHLEEISSSSAAVFPSLESFYRRAVETGNKPPADIMLALIQAGAFCFYGPMEQLTQSYYRAAAGEKAGELFRYRDRTVFTEKSSVYYNGDFLNYIFRLPLIYKINGNIVSIRGYVTKYRRIRTKQGKWMVFITMANQCREFECTLMPKIAEKFLRERDPSKPLYIKGVYDSDRGCINVNDLRTALVSFA